ncbi:MAG: methyltransferase [Polyangiaceae bacterium]
MVLADINPTALALATINADLAGAADRVEVVESDVLAGVAGAFDLVVSNPPYLVDDGARIYRDGGGELGSALSVRIAAEALARLQPGGRLLLYTGTAVVAGEHVLRGALQPALQHAASVRYDELDPDVFGEELERPAYQAVERLAVVGVDASM